MPSLLQALGEHLRSKLQAFYTPGACSICAFCAHLAGWGKHPAGARHASCKLFCVLLDCLRQAFCTPWANTCLSAPLRDQCLAFAETPKSKKISTLLDLCVSSLRRGHANLLCIVPILTDDPRRESNCRGRCMLRSIAYRRRPYRVECTGSLSTSEVKQRRARLVLGWGTAWEDPWVLSAFDFLFRTLTKCKFSSFRVLLGI